ncbi:MAG: Ig-like domain-containing protein [Vicinamibacterales bacterium]|nr:Ig-like domain-containing protein [Vicinamibacterales bacterium]
MNLRTRLRALTLGLLMAVGLVLAPMPGHGQGGTLVFEPGFEGEIWQALPSFGTTPACIDFYNFNTYSYQGCSDPAPGPGELMYPVDVALYQTGPLGANGFPVNPNDYRLYVTDSFNHRVVVYRFDPAAADDDPLDGYGWAEVDVPGAEWNSDNLLLPDHLAVDTAGNVFVADYGNDRVVVFDPAGQILATLPVGFKVYGIDVLPGTAWGVQGTIAVNGIDFGSAVNNIAFLSAVDGSWLDRYEAPVGDAVPGSLLLATGLSYDRTGSHLLVADLDNSRIVVWNTSANGLLVDGDPNDGIIPFSIDEDHPAGIPTMTPVLTFGRPASFAAPSRADLQSPFSVTVDSRGRIIVGDTDNQRLVVFQPDYPADGPATATFLFELNAQGGLNGYPRGVVEDAFGRLIVVDTANHEIEIFQIPSLAIVDVSVAGPRAHAPDVLRPGATLSVGAVEGDTVAVEFSVIVPEGRPAVQNVIPGCAVSDSQGPFLFDDAPVGPELVGWIPTALHTSLGSSGEIGLIRPIAPASPATSDVYRFRCTVVARVEGPLAFELTADGNDGMTSASSSRTSEATVGCAECETGLPAITAEVVNPAPRVFYNEEVTLGLFAEDVVDSTNVDDPRAGLPAAGIKRIYWQWVYGPLAFEDDSFIGCDDFPGAPINCDGPGLADGDPVGFPYPATYDVEVPVADWAEGYNILEYWTQDAAGNRTTRQQIVVTLDLTPPRAAFAYPAPTGPCWSDASGSHCWYTSSVTVPYSVFDNFTSSNQILVNGVAGASNVPLIFDLEGENPAMVFSLEDLAGNTSVASSSDPLLNGRIVHIDRVAPVTTLACTWTDGTTTLDCSAGGIFPGGTATVTLSATDATSGVKQTFYQVSGAPVAYSGPVVLPASTTFGYWTRDVAGNIEQAREISLVLNNPPTASDGTLTTAEDTPADVTLVASDPDGDALTYTVTAGPSSGTVTLAGNVATYTPAANYFGPDSFTFEVNDGNGGTSFGTIAVTVTPVNDAPVFDDQTATTPEDTPVDVTLIASDVDGDPLTFTITGGPANGTAVLVGNVLTYTPAADFHGTDTVTVQVSDGQGGVTTATVTIIVTPVNDAPVIADQSVTTPEDTPIDVPLGATDVDGDTLAYTITSGPANGTVAIVDGVLTYTPAPNFNGTDSVTVEVSDGAGGTATATITIIVAPVDDPPSVSDQTVTTPEDTPIAIAIGASHPDGNPLSYAIVSGPAHGTAVLTGGSIDYTPAADFHGTDTFTVLVTDDKGGSATATITIIVTPVNDAPVIADQGVETPEDTPVDVTLGATDVDGDTLTYTVLSGPVDGTVVIVDGVLTYTPEADFHGTDEVTVQVSDGQGGTATAVITIIVTPVNDAPVAVNDAASVIAGAAVVIDVLANDTDADGDTLSVASVSTPANGTAVVGVDGRITYTPAPGFVGTDAFTYIATDGQLQSAPATVTITVLPSNQAPFCGDAYGSPQFIAWPPNHRVVPISILGIVDPDGDTLTLTVDSIWQDEPTNTQGDGNTNVDGGVLPDGQPWVRAERMGDGDGRVYEIRFTATDPSGAACSGTVFIGVPHDQRGTPPVDSGVRYNSMTGEPVAPGGGGGDTTPPVIDPAPNQTVSTTDPDGQAVSYAAPSATGADGPVTVACAPASGSVFPVGTTTVTCTATDTAGSTATTTFTVTVTLSTPPPSSGSYRTQSQGGWGSPSTSGPGSLLDANFGSIYGSAGVTIGGSKTLRFTSAAAVRAFLPQGGTVAALKKSEVNPTKKITNLAGQVLALRLSVDFSSAGVTRSGLGSLRVSAGKLAGSTVNQVLALANQVLGGNTGALPSGVKIGDLNTVVDKINNNFVDGTADNGYLVP